MCGIFGIIAGKQSGLTTDLFKLSIKQLLKLSESRGKEASGLAIQTGSSINVLKDDVPAHMLIKSREYENMFHSILNNRKVSKSNKIENPIAVIGHSRLVTNGRQEIYQNNQPVIKDEIVGVHNGIIVNVNQLWDKFPGLKKKYEIDTEIILSLVHKFFEERKSLVDALQLTYEQIEGAAATALLFTNLDYVTLSTNNGSLYIGKNEVSKIIIFASEEFILKKFFNKIHFLPKSSFEITRINPRTGLLVNIDDLTIYPFNFKQKSLNIFVNNTKSFHRKIIEHVNEIKRKKITLNINTKFEVPSEFIENFSEFESHMQSLKRCKKCVLPETVPFIKFDDNGVCNYCNNYKKLELKGESALEEIISKYRSKTNNPDCIVAFSGGRDSSFGLHYIKNILKLNPISYTYDWGMVTDLARRNISRMTAKLGIENILVSADIVKKRANIKKNVLAWLAKPVLGMIPLFMAGDKQFLWYVKKVKQQTGIKLDIWTPNLYEKTNFKEDFSGTKLWDSIDESEIREGYKVGWIKSIKLAVYYAKNFITNPYYLNSSIIDTFFSYISYYFLKKDFLCLYEYIKWDENEIEETLIKEYNWETSPDTRTTWRIGDGTASFYNYIYYTITGFCENDTFRSTQIREGALSREKALEIVKEENKARWESIKWYCDTIGIDWIETIKRINDIPKIYKVR